MRPVNHPHAATPEFADHAKPVGEQAPRPQWPLVKASRGDRSAAPAAKTISTAMGELHEGHCVGDVTCSSAVGVKSVDVPETAA